MTMVSKTFQITNENTCQELQACLDEISNTSLLDSTIEWFGLQIWCRSLTPSILALLVHVLNQPLSKAGARTDNKWNKVTFCVSCRLVRPGVPSSSADNEGFCSEDGIQIFASSLATRTLSLCVKTHCDNDILECLFNTSHLAVKKLDLIHVVLSTLECARLADLVQRCTSLIDLCIVRSEFEEPLYLAKVLLDANLEIIHFHGLGVYFHRKSILDPLLCRDGGNCSLIQLLNPQSRLQALVLRGVQLNDCEFLSIVEMLPTSQLQVLNVCANNIGRQGILAFASQLPRIKLKQALFEYNNWCRSRKYRKYVDALLHGMLENYSLECLTVNTEMREEELDYCTSTNRERRLILATAEFVPVGLWPFILEKVGKRGWNPRWEQELIFRNYRANALHFVLQICALPFLATQKPIA